MVVLCSISGGGISNLKALVPLIRGAGGMCGWAMGAGGMCGWAMGTSGMCGWATGAGWICGWAMGAGGMCGWAMGAGGMCSWAMGQALGGGITKGVGIQWAGNTISCKHIGLLACCCVCFALKQQFSVLHFQNILQDRILLFLKTSIELHKFLQLPLLLNHVTLISLGLSFSGFGTRNSPPTALFTLVIKGPCALLLLSRIAENTWCSAVCRLPCKCVWSYSIPLCSQPKHVKKFNQLL